MTLSLAIVRLDGSGTRGPTLVIFLYGFFKYFVIYIKKETDGTLEESSRRRVIPHKVGYTYEGKSCNWLTQHKTACHTIALLTDLIFFFSCTSSDRGLN